MLYPDLLSQHLKILLNIQAGIINSADAISYEASGNSSATKVWYMESFFQIQRRAIEVDLSPKRAKPVRAQGMRNNWERTACCQEAPAALPAALI